MGSLAIMTHGAPHSRGGPGQDTLRRLLAELCIKGGKEVGGLTLREHVEEEARDLSGESFTRFMELLYERISALVESPSPADNLGAVHAIDELIDVSLGESAAKISRFAAYLRHVFEEKTDPQTMIAASAALGHLARAGGALTADVVEFQVKQALEWLHGDTRRFAAVLILKEMAGNAPTVFNVHVQEFIDSIWAALRDPKLAVREKAVEALRACLCVIQNRETRWRVQGYYRLFEETQKGLLRNPTTDTIHGSLLAIGELLRNTGEFMMARYNIVADTVLKFRDHRERLIRRAITALLPRVAHFLRDRFISTYLKIFMEHLLGVMRTPMERDTGFAALGEMAPAVGGALEDYIPQIAGLLKDAIAPWRGRPSMEALACVGQLAAAVGLPMQNHLPLLLDVCFASGLSVTLVSTLSHVALRLPQLLPSIQDRLLDVIETALARKGRGSLVGGTSGLGGGSDAGLTQLALRTLSTFDMSGQELLEFGKQNVMRFLDDGDPGTRREAGMCCCRLLHYSCAPLAAGTRASRARRKIVVVEEMLERLLQSCVADTDAGVRRSILSALETDGALDALLAQAECLKAVFLVLNDESYPVRHLAIVLGGRLAARNPAYVLPAMRCHLVQLLNDLAHSTDSKQRESSSRLLGCLIDSCTRLFPPYIAPLLTVLIAKLREGTAGAAASLGTAGGGGTSGVVGSVLATVGQVARVGGVGVRPYLADLLPLVVEALHDGGGGGNREVAVSVLGQLVESTGYVVAPYTDFPQLLGVLLRLLNGELAWSVRRAVLRVLGILGALDPQTHKRNQLTLSLQVGQGEGGRMEGAPLNHGPAPHGHAAARSVDEMPTELLPPGGMSGSSSDYYSMVALAALLRILRDGTLSSYHQRVVGSLMYIFKAMGLGCVPFLPKVLPELFHVMRGCEEGLREFLFWQLASLVAVVKHHIRKYLPELLSIVNEFWNSLLLPLAPRPAPVVSPVLHLIEQLSLALNDDFRMYIPDILPRCVAVLTEAERSNEYSRVLPVLHCFQVLGSGLEGHMHLLLPPLVRLFKPGLCDAPLPIKKAALRALARLLPSMQVAGHAAAVLHPLMRVVDSDVDELRQDAVDGLCALALALGPHAVIFVPAVRKLLHRHRIQNARFEAIAQRLLKREALNVPLPPPPPHAADPWVGVGGVASPTLALVGAEVDGERGGGDPEGLLEPLKVNEGNLRKAWESSQRSTREDWAEWMRHFSVELLKESPSPPLRTCAALAQLQPHVARELFAVGFVSCWAELNASAQEQLVRSLEAAFASPNIPPEILATLLNLAEFMEHDEKPLPVDIRTLGALAEKCHAFAKALHYAEMEFEQHPSGTVEALIHVNNHLQQHEAAVGILLYAQQHLAVELKESWYEALQRWEEALAAYERKTTTGSTTSALQEAVLGRMRCLGALARWEELGALCRDAWPGSEAGAKVEMAPLGATAAWNMGEWEEMADYVALLDGGEEVPAQPRMVGGGVRSSDGAFLRAVLCVRRGSYGEARSFVERARKLLATELAALVLESYERAYADVVRVQQLAELEEVIEYCTLPPHLPSSDARAGLIRQMWRERIRGAQRNVEVWQSLLAVRSLVLPMAEDAPTWLKFASLCRKSGRVSQSHSTLLRLLQYDPEQRLGGRGHAQPVVMLGYLKHLWSLGGEAPRRQAFPLLHELAADLAEQQAKGMPMPIAPGSQIPVLAKVYHKLGSWQWTLHPTLSEAGVGEIVVSLRAATELAPGWGKAWHMWALFNTAASTFYSQRGEGAGALRHVVAAVSGYFRSIALATSAGHAGEESLQDLLRLLTLWFSHGAASEVQAALHAGFTHVTIDTWLVVIPQIIARIHSHVPSVRNLIQSLLVRIGRHHPQALMFPLLVAFKSASPARRNAAQQVLDNVRAHSSLLIEQADMVSLELIRVAVLWHEQWHEGLEEASRLYFGERNTEGMLAVLEPLHAQLETTGASTAKEMEFVAEYGRELQEAHGCCLNYKRSGKEGELTQAWDLYYHVFKRINKQLPSLTTLELPSVSPALVEARNLELAMPGTYRAGTPVVTIAIFAPQIAVITSKQRPRKMCVHGSDGAEYVFLLKGHEDLRLDERVMQLFGLVNTILSSSRSSAEKDLSIERYAVVPLSPNFGLIGWLPNCDTLHQLIREYRDARRTAVNVEHRLMLAFAPDYDHLTLMAKVEVFEQALENTPGNDLARVLWLKSRSSEVWLDRRTNYTRSLAVMSMVGYLLGLGDRHPSNLMLDRFSGKIIHIDFGDCFEASMTREKFPEKVPFRLTRMLVKAMEVSGIEGTFRCTCEAVLAVMRAHKDSVMAMMEAFVHDPLINWRLLNLTHVPGGVGAGRGSTGVDEMLAPAPQRGIREREVLAAVGQLGDANEVLNERAVAVMTVLSNKLTGRDFRSGGGGVGSGLERTLSGVGGGDVQDAQPGLSVKTQVQRLIVQATLHENLCQSYIGWCPFW